MFEGDRHAEFDARTGTVVMQNASIAPRGARYRQAHRAAVGTAEGRKCECISLYACVDRAAIARDRNKSDAGAGHARDPSLRRTGIRAHGALLQQALTTVGYAAIQGLP
jgi:hypothetical protein